MSLADLHRPYRAPERRHVQVVALERVMLENDRIPGQDEVQLFADSLAFYIKTLKRERDVARAQRNNLATECDGLRLALRRELR